MRFVDEDRVVLHVGPRADDDAPIARANGTAEEDARVVAERDVAGDDRRRRDVGAREARRAAIDRMQRSARRAAATARRPPTPAGARDTTSACAAAAAQRARVLRQLVATDLADRFRRMPGIDAAARQRLARRNDAVGRDQRVRTDRRAVHDHRRFADDDAVAERARVNEAVAADRHVVTDDGAEHLVGDMDGRVLAEPCVVADADVLAVGAHRRVVGERRPRADDRSADDDAASCHVGAGAELRLVLQIVEDHATATGSCVIANSSASESAPVRHCPTPSAAGSRARGSVPSRDPTTACPA